jgi:hypothetical protein
MIIFIAFSKWLIAKEINFKIGRVTTKFGFERETAKFDRKQMDGRASGGCTAET